MTKMTKFIVPVWLLFFFIVGYCNNLRADHESTGAFDRKYKNLLIRVEYGRDELCSMGSYTLRIYDVKVTFDSFITGFLATRDGSIEDVFVTDINMNKKPDIIIWFMCIGSGKYGNIKCFEFDGQNLTELILPELSKQQRSGYRRYDNFKVVNGKVYHSFSKYNPKDEYIKPTGGRATFVYSSHDKKWLEVKKKN
jgi:PliI/PliC-like inhibitor of I-type lysozyme